MTGDLPPFITPPPGPYVPAARPAKHPVLAQVLAVVVFAGATFLGFLAALFLALGLASNCSEPVDGGRTLLLKAGLGVVGLLWAAVPAFIAHLSRRVHVGVAVPWLLVATGAVLVTLAAVIQAEAIPVFCF